MDLDQMLNRPPSQHYVFANRLLPHLLWQGDSVLGILVNPENEAFLGEQWDEVLARSNSTPSPGRERLSYSTHWLGGDNLAILISMPPPSDFTEAHFVVITTSPALRYFTLERSEGEAGRPATVLGEWSPDGHLNYGAGPAPEPGLFLSAVCRGLALPESIEEPTSGQRQGMSRGGGVYGGIPMQPAHLAALQKRQAEAEGLEERREASAAFDLYHKAIGEFLALYPEPPTEVTLLYWGAVRCLKAMGHADTAEEWARQWWNVVRRYRRLGHAEALTASRVVAEIVALRGRKPEAEALYRHRVLLAGLARGKGSREFVDASKDLELDFLRADAKSEPHPSVVPTAPRGGEPCILFTEDGQGRGYLLPDGEFTIGRDQSCSVVIRDFGLSRVHAKLTVTGDVVTITDLKSKGGTMVDGKPVSTATLGQQSQLLFGKVTIAFARSRGGVWPEALQFALQGIEWKRLQPLADPPRAIPPPPRPAAAARSPASTPAPRQRGLLFGGYRLLHTVAKSSESGVYQGIELNSGRSVLVRVWPPTGSPAPEPDWTPLLEIDHPNVVRVFSAGSVGGSHYVALEPWKEELAGVLGREPASIQARLALIGGICSGLVAAHLRGVVHGALGPRHVRLDASGAPGIDFSEAWHLGTGTRVSLGTAYVLSPERVLGRKTVPDEADDLYSAAALAYEILTGRGAFAAETLHATFYKITNEDPPDPRLVAPEVPTTIAEWVTKSLARDPSSRFGDAEEMCAAFEHAATIGADGGT